MTKIIYCKSLEEYIKCIVEKELVGSNGKIKVRLNDKKNKIKI